MRKEESAFVYFLLESYEGVVSYTTLPHRNGDPHRDLELLIPESFATEAAALLHGMGDLVHEIRNERRDPESG